MVRSMSIGAVLSGLMLAACETTSNLSGCGFQPGMRVVVPGYCKDRRTFLAIADAARNDGSLTEILLQGAISAGDCIYTGVPINGMVVKAVIDQFHDYKGRLTQVLEGTLIGAPERRIFTIVLAGRVRAPRPASCAESSARNPAAGSVQ